MASYTLHHARVFHRDVALAALLSTTFLAAALALLAFGHPHEDAFILFKYARNVAAGEGVVYYPGGPHAEGATDFAWMILLAGAVRAGADVAVAAAVLNAAGFFLASLLLLRSGGRFGPVFAIVLLVSPAATASYVGFGTMLYAACALALFEVYADASGKALLGVPWLALLLGLLRPDGVILGAAFAVLVMPRARREGSLVPYFASCAGSVVVGAAYFLWRWHYFGLLLPLPLYVKGHFQGIAPGWEDTADWGASTLLPLAGLAAAGRWLLGPTAGKASGRLLVGLAPFGVHVASFAANLPSQNVANRFEAPAALVVLYVVARLAAGSGAAAASRALGYAALVVASQAPLFPILVDVERGATQREYIDAFAGALPRITGGQAHLATTEAGRLAYFARDPVVDLDGLNTPETARRPPSDALLDGFDPDLILIHHAGTLDEARFGAPSGEDVVRLAGPLARFVTPAYAPLFTEAQAGALPGYEALHLENHVVAPVATMAWLDRRLDRYELYAVRFTSSRWLHYHLYALRGDSPFKVALLRELAQSHRN
jgi:hypothetical protein